MNAHVRGLQPSHVSPMQSAEHDASRRPSASASASASGVSSGSAVGRDMSSWKARSALSFISSTMPLCEGEDTAAVPVTAPAPVLVLVLGAVGFGSARLRALLRSLLRVGGVRTTFGLPGTTFGVPGTNASRTFCGTSFWLWCPVGGAVPSALDARFNFEAGVATWAFERRMPRAGTVWRAAAVTLAVPVPYALPTVVEKPGVAVAVAAPRPEVGLRSPSWRRLSYLGPWQYFESCAQ